MITYIKDNIINTDCGIIIHGCNAQGVMGAGVASTIKINFPQAYKLYKNIHSYGKLKLGSNSYVKCDGKIIVNAITQEFYGRELKQYVSYEAIRSCMKELKNYINTNNISTSIAMPKIGSGLGGGSWDIIERIIKEELSEFEIKVYEL
jgi:O-acetyl-ADP-ribose deacetylase (regulator of RNase III)